MPRRNGLPAFLPVARGPYYEKNAIYPTLFFHPVYHFVWSGRLFLFHEPRKFHSVDCVSESRFSFSDRCLLHPSDTSPSEMDRHWLASARCGRHFMEAVPPEICGPPFAHPRFSQLTARTRKISPEIMARTWQTKERSRKTKF